MRAIRILSIFSSTPATFGARFVVDWVARHLICIPNPYRSTTIGLRGRIRCLVRGTGTGAWSTMRRHRQRTLDSDIPGRHEGRFETATGARSLRS